MMASNHPSDLPISLVPASAVPTVAVAQPRLSSALNIVDLLLGIGVVLLGVLVASFAARNSDLFQHLAAGKLLATGEYQFGVDPFGSTSADRVWVNHSWLFDLIVYTGYNMGAPGSLLVPVKALFVGIVAALMLCFRRAGQSLWIHVVAVGLALLVCAPRITLSPLLASMLFTVLTLMLLTLVDRVRHPRAFVVGIALAFWLWASFDQWFFLGPLLASLYLVGGLVDRVVRGRDPARGTLVLAIALGVGIVACSLTPHHYRVWQVPAELASEELVRTLSADVELVDFVRGGLDERAFSLDGGRGVNPINSWSLVGLVAMLVLALGLEFKRVRSGDVLATATLLILGILNARLMIPFAVVAAPIAAMYLAEVAARISTPVVSARLARPRRFVRWGGRAAVALVGVLLGLIAWPGGLHPNQANARFARWVSWDVEIDGSLRAAAEQLGEWRTSGRLPPEVNGLILYPDLAHYCAWFAPAEKSFFDGRLTFHMPELADYRRFRLWLLQPEDTELLARTTASRDGREAFQNRAMAYVALGSLNRTVNSRAMGRMWRDDRSDGSAMWELWSLHGRVAAMGYRPQTGLGTPAFDALKFDPISQAFGSAAKLVPEPTHFELPRRQPFWDTFDEFPYPLAWTAPLPVPPDLEESLLLEEYQSIRVQKFQKSAFLARLARAATIGGLSIPTTPGLRYPDELLAHGLLTVRAARRAVAGNPDLPETHLALARAYQSPLFLVPADIRQEQTQISLEQTLLRSPPESIDGQSLLSRLEATSLLAEVHKRAERYDLTVRAQKLREDYIRVMLARPSEGFSKQAGEGMLKQFEAERQGKDGPEEYLELNTNTFEVQTQGRPPIERATVAMRMSLNLKALDILRDPAAFQNEPLGVQIQRMRQLVELLLLTGQIEELRKSLLELDRNIDTLVGDNQLPPNEAEAIRGVFRQVRFVMQRLSGEFEPALEEMVGMARLQKQQNDRTLLEMSVWAARDIASRPGSIPTQSVLSLDNVQNRIPQIVASEGSLNLRMGLVALELGDLPRASNSFRLAMRPRDTNVAYADRPIAQEYLRLLQANAR